ncbi:uncharacterized protein LOC123536016 [Mercenaria mercenaria]|uniref:uncharacterized protein LOC123536016 n=1 Tax=Mercenaria mercenaria TaxID=6596 RepID=UPI00234F2369|nr:uncharacterized protein LOC123536016 [Mercenaria mercenaria]
MIHFYRSGNTVTMKEQTEQNLRAAVENSSGTNKMETKHLNGPKGVENGSEIWRNNTNSNTLTKCELHNNTLLYCSECCDIVCGQCEQVHSSHTMIKLNEASKQSKTKLGTELTNVKNLIRYANHVLKDLHLYLEKLAVLLAEITTEILKRAESLPEGTELLTETILTDVQNEHDLQSNRIRDKIVEFENFIASAKTIAVNCENLCSAADDKYILIKGNTELLSASDLINSLPMCPKEKCIYVLSPVAPVKDDQKLTPEETLGDFTKVSVPWRIEVKRIGSLRPEAVASSRFVTTMCPESDDQVWVCWQWGPKIHLVNKEGNVEKTIDVGCKVDDMCRSNGNLVVSSHEKKCIKIFDSNHEVVKTINTEKVPRGVYLKSNNELVLCCVQNLHHRNGDQSSLLKLGVEDGSITDFGCTEHLIQPWRVAVNINGDMCVSDRNKGAVIVFDKEGNLKATYSGPDNTTRHPFAPHAICCDQFGQIFVVDYTNHTVHVLDPLGRFRGFLIMDTELEKRAIFMGTSSPFSITIDRSGDVWVGNKFGYLTILKYLK